MPVGSPVVKATEECLLLVVELGSEYWLAPTADNRRRSLAAERRSGEAKTT